MKKILVVDDSKTVREVIKSTLGRYDVYEASNGEEALRIIKTDNFNLVITDLNMPIMNGCELSQEIRKIQGYRFIPILMLTTSFSSGEAKQCGASAWLAKPFRPEQIVAILNMICPP